MNSTRFVLSVCAAYKNVMEQLDANTAFLNSGLVELVYAEDTFGVMNAKGTLCKWEKTVYGSKKATSAQDKIIYRVFLQSGF
uniref:Reverse transcriptase Ty1/copia-type domain-containing protein n=1 Tax=Peronospora matthiolae TaxID=2874970 RepID=A0AAV1U5G3_9STRA